jgi:hypothetical protein
MQKGVLSSPACTASTNFLKKSCNPLQSFAVLCSSVQVASLAMARRQKTRAKVSGVSSVNINSAEKWQRLAVRGLANHQQSTSNHQQMQATRPLPHATAPTYRFHTGFIPIFGDQAHCTGTSATTLSTFRLYGSGAPGGRAGPEIWSEFGKVLVKFCGDQ